MKTFEEILQFRYGTEDEMQYVLTRLSTGEIQNCVNEFATQVAKDALKRAAKNARTETITKGDGWESWEVKRVDEDTILRTEIILP